MRIISGAKYKLSAPRELVTNGTDIFVPQVLSNTVTEIDAAGTLVKVIHLPSSFVVTSLIVNGHTLFAGGLQESNSGAGSSAVAVFDYVTGSLQQMISGSAYSFDGPSALTTKGATLFVANEIGGSVTMLPT